MNDTTSAETGLLPCPFCGSGAKLSRVHREGEKDIIRAICNKHECEVGFNIGDYTEGDAMERWNRRVPQIPDASHAAVGGSVEPLGKDPFCKNPDCIICNPSVSPAHEAREGLDTIHGWTVREYMDYQFPATKGHLPWQEWLAKFESALAQLNTVKGKE